jgi:hypothetical protein
VGWQVLLSTLVGVLTCVLLRALSVDLWLAFGVIAFWLNFIPNVGALIAVGAPMPLVLFSPSFGLGSMLLALLLPLLVHVVVRTTCSSPSHPIPSHPIPSHPIASHPIPSHPIPSHPIPSHPIASHRIASHPIPSHPIPSHLISSQVGNLLEPVLFGKTMELHPVTVLLSLMLWGTLWGVPGLILATVRHHTLFHSDPTRHAFDHLPRNPRGRMHVWAAARHAPAGCVVCAHARPLWCAGVCAQPLTAVLKIHLAHIEHPLPRLLLRLLDGGQRRPTARTAEEFDEMLPLHQERLAGHDW